MALYNIAFTVGLNTVEPATPQRAGVFGDKGKAIVNFVLASGFSPGSNCQYRVEITDGAGGYDVTELMLANNGKISLEIPESWTTAGIAELRLVAVELDDELNEEERWHSVPAYITFDNRNNGEKVFEAAEPEWRETLNKAKRAAEEAKQQAETAAACAVDCTEARTNAEAAAASAVGAAGNVGEFLEKILEAETAAVESAVRAEAARTAAEERIEQGEKAIDSAVETAVSAQSMAEAFAAQCHAVLEQVETLSGLTASIRQVVGV